MPTPRDGYRWPRGYPPARWSRNCARARAGVRWNRRDVRSLHGERKRVTQRAAVVGPHGLPKRRRGSGGVYAVGTGRSAPMPARRRRPPTGVGRRRYRGCHALSVLDGGVEPAAEIARDDSATPQATVRESRLKPTTLGSYATNPRRWAGVSARTAALVRRGGDDGLEPVGPPERAG